MTKRYFIQTARIGFRKWRTEDADLAIGLWGDFEVTKLFDARGGLSGNQAKERLLQEIETEQRYGVQYWPIFLLQNDEHLGACGLRPYQPEKNIFEIGFHLRSDQWGKGYATEAARKTIRYAFEELGINELFAGHNPKNSASAHLLQKLGFRYSHDEFYEPTGLQHPSYFLSLRELTS